MLTGYTLHRPGQPVSEASAELPRKPCLDALRDLLTPLLGTADFERVAVLRNGGPANMFVNGNGIMKRLDHNGTATALYRAAWLRRYPDTNPDTLSSIYGPAVVFDRPVWF